MRRVKEVWDLMHSSESSEVEVREIKNAGIPRKFESVLSTFLAEGIFSSYATYKGLKVT